MVPALKLGDPVEINALKKGFTALYQQWGKPMPQVPSCGLGAVKTYIGHLEAAAGVAGIIKTVLSMKHKTLPRNLHFTEINPYIDLKNTPFYIVDKTEPWKVLKDEQGRPLPRRSRGEFIWIWRCERARYY
jgi:polyketide synthase PksN